MWLMIIVKLHLVDLSSSSDPDFLRDNLVQFVHSSGGLRARRSSLQLIWLCCVWVLWNE